MQKSKRIDLWDVIYKFQIITYECSLNYWNRLKKATILSNADLNHNPRIQTKVVKEIYSKQDIFARSNQL